MVGDIQRLAKVIGHVTSYSSLLTNGLAWLHLRRIDKDGVVWLHSSPICVVKTAGRRKHTVDEAGIDIVVQNILYALVTAKFIVEDITDKLASKQKVDIDHGEVNTNFYFLVFLSTKLNDHRIMTKIISRKMTTRTAVRTAKKLVRTIQQITEKEGQRNPATK